jgi:hypothetical protein
MQAARQEEVAKAIAGLREYTEIAGAAQQRSLSSRLVCLTSLPEQENGWLQKPVVTLRRSQRLAGFEPVICPEASAVRVLVRRGSPWGAIVGGTSGVRSKPRRLVGRAQRPGTGSNYVVVRNCKLTLGETFYAHRVKARYSRINLSRLAMSISAHCGHRKEHLGAIELAQISVEDQRLSNEI